MKNKSLSFILSFSFLSVICATSYANNVIDNTMIKDNASYHNGYPINDIGNIDFSNPNYIMKNHSGPFPSDAKDFSTNENLFNSTDENNKLDKEEIYKQYNLLPFPDHIVGIKDSEAASVVRSLANGISAQYIIFDNKIKEGIVDTNILTKELNEYIESVGKYFRKNSDFKGGFVTYFTLYPSFISPFQYDVESLSINENIHDKEIRTLKNRNVLLKKISNCNQAGYCGAFVIDELNYFTNTQSNSTNNSTVQSDENTELEERKFDIIDFEDHLILENRKGKQIFAYNKDFREPISIILFLGTNGYLITPEQVQLELIED